MSESVVELVAESLEILSQREILAVAVVDAIGWKADKRRTWQNLTLDPTETREAEDFCSANLTIEPHFASRKSLL